jgi:AhpD family alkylhydroperoxidase
MPENMDTATGSIYTQQVRELVAIGAAIAANCEPCFKFHYDKAHKLGVLKEDMLNAVETAKMVKEASTSNLLSLAKKYLNGESSPCDEKRSCCS